MTEREKRKATAPPPTDSDTPRSSKRLKLPNLPEETAAGTTELGHQCIESVKTTKDKHGRAIATDFLTLPKKNTPRYYKEIKLPIAINTIEDKLKKKQYPNLSALEGDIKRMVQNAKQFNTRGSTQFDDAERIRKTASNWMTKHNPAYRIPGYQAVPTPIPGEDVDELSPEADQEPVVTATLGAEKTHSRRSSRMLKNTDAPVPTSEPESPAPDAEGEETIEDDAEAEVQEEQEEQEETSAMLAEGAGRFKSKTFQEAQYMIMDELIDYTEDGLQIYLPFVTLPPRTLTDYFAVIKHPVSLKAVQKRIRGQHGRSAPTGVTDFHTWDQYEQEVSFIWINARTYNEDGSDMYNLAGDFEADFNDRLQEAKSVIEQPKQQTVKLKLTETKLKIKLGVHKDSPGSTPGPSTPGMDRATPGVIVDSEALQRQQQLVSAGMNGIRSKSNGTRNPISSSATPIPTVPAQSRSASAASPPRQTNGVKNEGTTDAAQGAALRISGSPLPQAQPSLLPSLYPSSHNSIHHTTAYSDGPPPGLVESKIRPSKQNPSEYLLPSTQFTTHPMLNSSSPFKARVPASKASLHQNVTFQLSGAHYYLQVTPHIPVGLTNRPYRLFVSVNGTRVSETVKPSAGERDRSRPVFEARLDRGAVNKVEVEVLAGKADAQTGEKDEVEWEKLTCFVHCLRI